MTHDWTSKDRSVRILVGNVTDRLRDLPDESVHCVVTSPPYWGLRDYGTAEWEGGDAGCDHQGPPMRTNNKPVDADASFHGGTMRANEFYRHVCAKCGARRIDQQIGLEETPEAYVARMVEVFREVRRVMRPDATLWLNLGSSYASSTSNQSQSPLLLRVPACGSGDKGFPGFQAVGRACPDSCDEPQGGIPNRHAGTVHNDQSDEQGEPLLCSTGRDSEPVDCGPALLSALLPDVLPSKQISSSQQFPVNESSQFREAEYPTCEPTSLPAIQESAHTEPNTPGTSLPMPILAVRTVGKESFYTACHRSDCKGVGRCGLCWCSLAIPSLQVKPKDEMNMPHLVAMALQADGWILRQTIVWSKLNPMPESVTDRTTKAHEYLFLLTKSARYFWDQEAVKEKTGNEMTAGDYQAALSGYPGRSNDLKDFGGGRGKKGFVSATPPNGRNRRSVWTIATAPYPEAHFATYPPALVTPCIQAGTSERGCCPHCGKPWGRVVEKTPSSWEDRKAAGHVGGIGGSVKLQRHHGATHDFDNRVGGFGNPSIATTLGWQPQCTCPAHEPQPCLVLDPFLGSGTTAQVARQLNRHAVGIELNPEYAKLARKRSMQRLDGEDDQLPLFGEVMV